MENNPDDWIGLPNIRYSSSVQEPIKRDFDLRGCITITAVDTLICDTNIVINQCTSQFLESLQNLRFAMSLLSGYMDPLKQ